MARSLLPEITDVVRHGGFNEANVWADIEGLSRELRMLFGDDPHPLRSTPLL